MTCYPIMCIYYSEPSIMSY